MVPLGEERPVRKKALMRRIISWRRTLITAISCLALIADAASGVVLTVDSAQSTVDAQLVVSIVSDTETLVFSGTMTTDAVLVSDPTFGVVVDSVQVTSADLGLSDGAWFLSFLTLVNVNVNSTGLRATASSGPIVGTPIATNTSQFELLGSVMTFNEGTVVATGSALGSPVNVNDDLSVVPLVFPFENSTIATAIVTDLGDGLYDINVSIPVEASVIVLQDPQVTTLNLSNGMLVLNGTMAETANPVPMLGHWRTLGLIMLLLAVGFAAVRRQQIQHS